uniref:Uncharacterized protein n=1 Tax=Globodera rostochiensis TaxID=31243 RepID=A0A914HBK3_GLORO
MEDEPGPSVSGENRHGEKSGAVNTLGMAFLANNSSKIGATITTQPQTNRSPNGDGGCCPDCCICCAQCDPGELMECVGYICCCGALVENC